MESATDMVDGDVAVIRRRHNMVTAPSARRGRNTVIDRGSRKVVLNLSAIEFMDSTELCTIIVVLKRACEQDNKHGMRFP